jgi:glutaredoxin
MPLRYVILLLAFCAFGAWRHFDTHVAQAPASEVAPLPEGKGTVVVYGRDGCSYTRRMLATLRSEGVPTTYLNLEDPAVNAAFQTKFHNSGLVTEQGYPLPIVEINGHARARPDPDGIASDFRISQRIAAQAAHTN